MSNYFKLETLLQFKRFNSKKELIHMINEQGYKINSLSKEEKSEDDFSDYSYIGSVEDKFDITIFYAKGRSNKIITEIMIENQ